MTEPKAKPFQFKQFDIHQDKCMMKVGTDGVLLGAWADVKDVHSILDIGTGSGVIAIMLGQRSETARIDGLEIDDSAYEQTEENMERAPWANRMQAFHTSVQEFAKSCTDKYDLIVSNPPFFSGGTFSNNQDRNSVRHTIKLPHGDLLSAVRKLLAPQGKFCLILPYIEGLRFQELAQSYKLYCTRVTQVKPKEEKQVERLLLQFEQQEKEMIEDELIIQNDGRNDWTEQYIELTKAFYLKM
jgi:tRNA1Val (adenine37-N6)-methyltransferase